MGCAFFILGILWVVLITIKFCSCLLIFGVLNISIPIDMEKERG